jgi:hypothetical protein
MTTCDLEVTFPDKEMMLDQDEEWFHLETEEGRERIRIHDYDRVYDVPGLYEEVVYNRLQCDSPRILSELLHDTIAAAGEIETPLRILDFGAGNGIVGECLRPLVATEAMVGIDIIDEAKSAVERDRPGVYDDYHVMDLSQPKTNHLQALADWNFNALVTVAALGFGDIPTQAFVNAFNLVENHSWVVFNIKDRFFSDSDDTGYNEVLQAMIGRSLKIHKKQHYCHRYAMTGEPLHYYAVIGRKETAF